MPQQQVRATGSVHGDYKLICSAYPWGFVYDSEQAVSEDVLKAYRAARREGGLLILLRRYAQGWICEQHEVN